MQWLSEWLLAQQIPSGREGREDPSDSRQGQQVNMSTAPNNYRRFEGKRIVFACFIRQRLREN